MKIQKFILVKMKYCYQSMRKWLVRTLWKKNIQLRVFMDFSIKNWFLYKWWIKGRDETNDNVDELGFAPSTVKLQDACNYA